jgi:hypothetical protein
MFHHHPSQLFRIHRVLKRGWFPLLVLLSLHCTHSPLAKYEQSSRVWENDILRFEQLDRTVKDPENAVLFVGSSSIKLWSNIQEDMTPYSVIQRGFGGSKISDVAWFFKRIVFPHRFKAMLMFVANDITGAPDDKSPEEVAALFQYILDTFRKHFPETPIFFIEITPTISRWTAWPRIAEANQLIRSICERETGTYFINTSDRFIGLDGKPIGGLFVEDKLHLNRDGYKLWSELIKKGLNFVFSKNR